MKTEVGLRAPQPREVQAADSPGRAGAADVGMEEFSDLRMPSRVGSDVSQVVPSGKILGNSGGHGIDLPGDLLGVSTVAARGFAVQLATQAFVVGAVLSGLRRMMRYIYTSRH